MEMNPESDAQQLLKAVWTPGRDDLPAQLPVDPFVIAQKLGIKAYAAALDEGISGMLVKRAGEDPEIYVHAADSPNRRRFTCAHELGHYYKRSTSNDAEWEYVEHRDLLTSAGSDPEEIYANRFAASLLMPSGEVERRCAEGSGLPTLAYEFGVSEDAMRFRLANLGLK